MYKNGKKKKNKKYTSAISSDGLQPPPWVIPL